MKYYIERGFETMGVTLAVSLPLGWLDNVVSALIVALFTFFILPYLDMIGKKFIAYLKTKGVSDDIAEQALYKIQLFAIKEINKKIEKAKRANDLEALDVLSKELEKIVRRDD